MSRFLILLGYVVGTSILDSVICSWWGVSIRGPFEMRIAYRTLVLLIGAGLYIVLRRVINA